MLLKLSARTAGCADGYSIVLGTTGELYQPDVAGNYNQVCTDANGFPIFKHESNDLYLYNSEIPNAGRYWFVAAKINGSPTFFGTSSGCPETAPDWFVKSGSGVNDWSSDDEFTISII